MARRTRQHHSHKKSFTIPMAIIGGLTPAVHDLWDHRGDIGGMLTETGKIFTGWDYYGQKFDLGAMKWGTIPLALGIIIHKVVGEKLGVNRQLAKAGIPLLRV